MLSDRPREESERAELRALHDLFLAQQEQLHDLRQRIAALNTKGAPIADHVRTDRKSVPKPTTATAS